MTTNTSIPYGLRVLKILSYLRLFGLFTSVFLFASAVKLSPETSSLIPSMLTPDQYIVFGVSLLTIISALVAIQKRIVYAHAIAAIGFTTNICISLYGLWGAPVFDQITGFLLTAPSFVILWYWIKMKPYFQDPAFNPDAVWVVALDRRVNVFLIIWFVITVAGFAISTVSTLRAGLQASKEQEVYLKAFEGKSFKERNEYCLSQETTEKRDICLFRGFSYTKNKDNITVDSCNLISSEGLRMTCYATIEECQLISESAMRQLCELGKKK